MNRQDVKPVDPGKEDRYAQILSAAARLFEEVGFPATTVREIARRVNIKSASIFYHFKDKDELLYRVMESTITDIVERQRLALKDKTELTERLRALIKVEMESFLVERETRSFETLIHEWRHLKPEGQKKLLALRAAYEQHWDDILDECIETGLLTADRRVTRRMLNGAFAWTRYWFREDNDLSFDDIVEEVMKLLLHTG